MKRASAALPPAFYLTPKGVLEFDDMSDLEDANGDIVIECSDGEPLVLSRVVFR